MQSRAAHRAAVLGIITLAGLSGCRERAQTSHRATGAAATGADQRTRKTEESAARGLAVPDLDIKIAPELAGLEIRSAEAILAEGAGSVVLYAVLPPGFSGTLRLTAVDKRGAQLMTATASPGEQRGEARRLAFIPGRRFVPMDASYYRLSRSDRGDRRP